MAKQTVNLGTSPNQGDGDPIRTAMRKINENFDELYAGNFADPENTTSNIIPSADATYDLGSPTNQWADLHVSDFIYLNGSRIEVTESGALLVNGSTPLEVQDIQGSVFADDSSVMVDAINQTMFAETLTTLGVFGNPTLSLNADFIGIDAQNGNLILQSSDTILNNFINSWEVQGISASIELTDDGNNSELGLNIDVVDFGTGNTIDMQNCSVALTGASFSGEPWISLADLKTVVAASIDFTDFQTRIAAL